MSAYWLFDDLEITDPAKLDEYKARVAPVVQRFGGRYVVLGGSVELAEGTWRPTFPVMIEFPTLAQARHWYDSAEYRAIKPLRLAAGRFNAVLLEGLDDGQEGHAGRRS